MSIQTQLDTAAGSTFYVPKGTHVGDLDWRYPCRIIGDGMTQSVINGNVRINPAVLGENEFGWSIEAVRIKGSFIIDLDDAPSEFLAKFRMSDCWVSSSGRAFSMNKAGSNINGFFTSVIESSRFDGGGDHVISLNRSGDSLKIRDCSITGTGIGIYTAPVAGAAQQVFEDNNVTASGGAVYIKGGQQVIIRGGQFEQPVPHTGADGAMIVLDGTVDCRVMDANINGHTYASCVRIKGASPRNSITRNVMTATASTYHFVLDTASVNELGPNTYITNGALSSARIL